MPEAPPTGEPQPPSGVRRYASAFGRFWWEFVVGDDWRAAAGVVTGIALTAGIAAAGAAAWWVLPVAVAGVLYLSLRRATRPNRAEVR